MGGGGYFHMAPDMLLPIDSEVLPRAQNLDQEDSDAITARIAQLLQSREEAGNTNLQF